MGKEVLTGINLDVDLVLAGAEKDSFVAAMSKSVSECA